MSEQRKNQIFQQFRRPAGSKSSKSKDIKTRLHHLRSKQTFLTDTQTSDYTKSSGQINLRCEHHQQKIRKLEKENTELKQRIVELKTTQYFEINEEKIKLIIKETEKLRQDLEKTKKDLEQSLVERDFLDRFNRNLKAQCESLTKEILVLRGSSTTGESKKNDKSIYTSRDQAESSKSRNSSNELLVGSKRKQFIQWKKEKEENNSGSAQPVPSNLLKNSLSESRLHEDYYPSRTSRHKAYKNF